MPVCTRGEGKPDCHGGERVQAMNKKTILKERVAEIIESLADAIEKKQKGTKYQSLSLDAEIWLLDKQNKEGLILLNRISTLLLSDRAKFNYCKNPNMAKRISELKPIDISEDTKALRSLAREVREWIKP
jgi:hypothetical protein